MATDECLDVFREIGQVVAVPYNVLDEEHVIVQETPHVGIVFRRRSVDHRDVRKCLRKIPKLTPRNRIVFFGKEAKVISQFKQTLEKFLRFLFPADEMQAIGQPK